MSDMNSNNEANIKIPEPEKFIGKDVGSFVHRLKELNVEHRIARVNGLLTADYHTQRLTLITDNDGIVVDAYYG